LCQKQATDCKSVVNGLQRYEKWNISWMCLHKHSQLTLFYQTSTGEVTHKIRMKWRVSFKWHDMHVKIDKSHHLTTMLSLCTTDRKLKWTRHGGDEDATIKMYLQQVHVKRPSLKPPLQSTTSHQPLQQKGLHCRHKQGRESRNQEVSVSYSYYIVEVKHI
jgi:uncharacterized protein YacL (UPF0231 family)